MNDLQTVLKIVAKHKGKLLTISVLVGLAVYFYPRAHVEYVSVSPDRTYRIEMYYPSLFQWLLNRDKQDAGFVRLYRNFDNQYFGESEVVDFFGGAQTMWMMDISGRVRVGRDVVFEGVPPVTAAGEVMKVPNPAAQ
ncbi:MAG: hypothetical protein HY308_03935 [Gammaproteobacteria bacterium]|nr:hypothetical protein [Gammaproteobacteria bacterium]